MECGQRGRVNKLSLDASASQRDLPSARPEAGAAAAILYRGLREDDDLEALTVLLHRAYRPLAERGMRFMASHQDVATTKRRVLSGETTVADLGGRVVGTITLRGPGGGRAGSHYARPDVAAINQFAVDPDFQNRGIGSDLLAIAERRAREKGATRLALDTSEGAHELIAMYAARGFRFVEYIRWENVNYRSVLLSRDLPPDHDE